VIGCDAHRWASIVLYTLLGFSPLTLAGNWQFLPEARGDLSYTDNLFLDSNKEVNDFLLEVTPGFRLDGHGRRLQLTADYSLQAVHYQDHSDFDDQYHQFSSGGIWNILDDRLFLDFGASYDQDDISLDQPGSGDNLLLTGNRTDTKIWSVSPYWRQNLGSEASIEIRYDHRRLTDTDQTRINSWTGVLQSLPGRGPVGWQFQLSDRRQDYEFSPASRFRRGNLRFSIPTWKHQQVILQGGYENDEYARAPGTQAPDGGTWLVGYSWRPGVRTAYEVNWGSRFFGDSFAVHALHGVRRWRFSLDYTEDTSSNALSRLENDQLQRSEILAPIEDPLPPADASQLVEAGNQDVFIQRRLVSGVRFDGKNNRLALTVSRDKRESQAVTGSKSRNDKLKLGWELDLQAKLSAIFDAEWQHRVADTSRDYREWRVSIGLERKLGRSVKAFTRIRHVLRQGKPLNGEYRSNSINSGLMVNY